MTTPAERSREFNVDADGGGLLGATFRVLEDGRLQVETDEAAWTLDLADSHAVASLMIGELAEGKP